MSHDRRSLAATLECACISMFGFPVPGVGNAYQLDTSYGTFYEGLVALTCPTQYCVLFVFQDSGLLQLESGLNAKPHHLVRELLGFPVDSVSMIHVGKVSSTWHQVERVLIRLPY